MFGILPPFLGGAGGGGGLPTAPRRQAMGMTSMNGRFARRIGPVVYTAGLITVGDSFDRTDSATSLGIASDGQAYTTADSFWGISGNKAYNPCAAGASAGSQAVAYRNGTGSSTYHVSADITVPGSGNEDPGLVFRVQDNNNFCVAFLQMATLTVQLYKMVAGVLTNLTGSAGLLYTLGSAVNLDVFTEASVGQMQIRVNGGLVLTINDLQFASLSKIGMYTNVPTATGVSRWENLTVT